MSLEIKPIIDELQKKLLGISILKDEPKIAVLLEGNVMFFIDTEKGQILVQKSKEKDDGGGHLDEVREGDVSDELQSEASVDGQREEGGKGPSDEV